ncbi:hypothetical protein ACMA1D_10875 [Streptomyces sp. 796.1]|uniref:hypothetical protein n=1 Tax=Streptomyces sp. 796.1 TaxID=3163029 RepID=UPI0039C9668E
MKTFYLCTPTGITRVDTITAAIRIARNEPEWFVTDATGRMRWSGPAIRVPDIPEESPPH